MIRGHFLPGGHFDLRFVNNRMLLQSIVLLSRVGFGPSSGQFETDVVGIRFDMKGDIWP